MPELFNTAASVDTPWVGLFLRRGYGLGAMALVGGSFEFPTITASWPQGEFGGMGLEGAVGWFQKSWKRCPKARRVMRSTRNWWQTCTRKVVRPSRAYLEIDMVIDPAESRKVILRASGRVNTVMIVQALDREVIACELAHHPYTV